MKDQPKPPHGSAPKQDADGTADASIISLFESRDESAIALTAQRFGRYCYAVAYNILDNHEDAEECVNDAYLAVWNAIPPQKPHSLQDFLVRITRNLALDRYKHDHRRKRGGGQVPLVLEELAEVVSGEDDVPAAYEQAELLDCIRRALESQTPRDRGLFLDRYLRLDSAAVLAHRYGIREGQVYVILSRVRKKLKAQLEKEGYTL